MKMKMKNRQWLRNPDQRKNEKTFQMEMVQRRDGSFAVVNGSAQYKRKVNQHTEVWEAINTRDLASEIIENGLNF